MDLSMKMWPVFRLRGAYFMIIDGNPAVPLSLFLLTAIINLWVTVCDFVCSAATYNVQASNHPVLPFPIVDHSAKSITLALHTHTHTSRVTCRI